MAVPIGFFRNKSFTTNLRGALKIDSIFATDNAVGTEAFQGWLADANVVQSFNDALIENNIGVVDTENFNISLSNRFAYTTMSGGRKLAVNRLTVVEFQKDINPLLGTIQKGNVIEFFANGNIFGSVTPPSNGDGFKIFGIVREKNISIANISYNSGNGVATVFVDPNENLTEFSLTTSTGNNYQVNDTVIIQGVFPTQYNGSYKILTVTSSSFTIQMPSPPPAYVGSGIVYKTTNKLLLTSVLRGRAINVTYGNNQNTISLGAATIQGQISTNQTITGPGIPAGTRVGSYNEITKTILLTQSTNGGGSNVTLQFEKDSASNLVVPTGAIAVSGSPAPFTETNAGTVVTSYQISTPKSYYINGDSRLNYFWSSFYTNGPFGGFDPNFISDGTTTGSLNGVATQQLIGTDLVFAEEDTFNNVIKTFNTVRGEAQNDDYNPQSKSALLYISATDSQGTTGATGRGGANKIGSSTPAYTVNDTVKAINDKNGYWIGIIGGSFLSSCKNEIQTFRKDTLDGIKGDPRGFTPIKGEVTSLRVGVPIQTASFNGTDLVTCTTYYDHKFGPNGTTLRIRIKNSTSPDLEGLKDITVTSPKQFTFVQSDVDIQTKVNFDDYGYALNITELLTVPKGFYRKSALKYINSVSQLNDSRLFQSNSGPLADPPGVGLERQDILVTIQVTETTGTLQYFSAYPLGDFFVGLPTLNEDSFFSYPVDSRDIKFNVKVSKSGPLEYIETTLINPGTSFVTPREEFSNYIYATEFTSTVSAQDVNNQWIDVQKTSINLSNEFNLGRGNAVLNTGGSGYTNGDNDTTFTAENVSTTPTTGTGSGLTFDINVVNGIITGVLVNNNGTGYDPSETGTINAPSGGSFTTAATYRVRTLEEGLFVELSLNPDGTQDSGIPGKTIIQSIQDNGSTYRLTLSKTLTDNIIGKQLSYIFPIEQRIIKVFVKPSNNFKDIDVTQSAIDQGAVNPNSDIFITFAGYGYSEQDVLTPVDVTNLPATVDTLTPPIWIQDTKISLEGFIYSGLSVSGETSFIVENVSGTISGVGASFRVTQSISQFYIVELLDQGTNFQATERIIIPGYTLGGSSKPSFLRIIESGTGYTPGNYTNIPTSTNGSGTGLLLNLTIEADGSLDPLSLELITTSANNYALGDSITLNSPSLTTSGTPIEFTVENTENDLNITITEIEDNSRVVLTTTTPHNFVPPLGRNTVDILVENIVSSGGQEGSFNGRFSALVVDGTTLEYNLFSNPGTYVSGGVVTNISIDVVNDTFAKFSEELFFNINQPTNNPYYPKIRFINTAQYDNGNILITTSEPHGYINNEEVRISGLATTRNSDWNIGKAIITVPAVVPTTIGNLTVTDNTTQFIYQKTIGGNAGIHITGTGEVTNPYVKVVGGVYTKNFNRIIFANTSDQEIDILDENDIVVDSIPSDTTKDFVVRDINFKQISNDGNEVKDGSYHNFHLLAPDTLAVARRILTISSIDVDSVNLEYIVTTSSVHGFYVDNYINIDVGTNPFYGTPGGGGALPDQVVRVLSPTQFTYKIYRTGRDPDLALVPPTASNPAWTVTKNVGSNIIFSGLRNGIPFDLVNFVGLNGMPGLSQSQSYYVVNYNEINAQGNTNYITFKLSTSKTGAPLVFTANINNVLYNQNTETASIEVTSTTPHNLNPGDVIVISGTAGAAYNGQKTVSEIISPTIFTIVVPPDTGIPDVANDRQTKQVITGTVTTVQSSEEIKRVQTVAGRPNVLQIRTTGQDSGAYNVAIGMRVVAEQGTDTTAALPSTTQFYVTGWSPASREITLNTNLSGTITGSNSRIRLRANVAGCSAIALDPQSTPNPGISNLQIGQKLDPATGVPANTYITDIYVTTEDSEGASILSTNAAYKSIITVSNPLTANIPDNQILTVADNVQGAKSIRIKNYSGSTAPLVGSEVVHFNSSGQATTVVEDGSVIVSSTPYTTGGVSGYLVQINNSLIGNVPQPGDPGYVAGSEGTFKFFPKSNLGPGGTVGGVTTTVTNNIIDNQNTTIKGQVYLASDVVGWDHVKLAKNTGGAVFFQLGFAKRFTGNINSNTITAIAGESIADIPTGTAAAGYGVYGPGIAPGATIVSVSGSTITLSDNNIAPVGGGTGGSGTYIGFARPNSVSIFPKYTQEFGRILGKTFAEWLFKIA